MDYTDYLKFFFALILVLSLMGGLALVLKRLGYGQGRTVSGQAKRLKIIETLPISPKHKAVLIQRDDTQHLILLGANNDSIIETNIKVPKEAEDTKK